MFFYCDMFDEEDCISSGGSDLEDLSEQNHGFRPYRDEQPIDSVSMESNINRPMERNTINPETIRKKVKQSIAKKQQKARRTKRGEAGLVTSKSRNQHSVIKQDIDGFW